MNHASLYCKTPHRVTKAALLNSLHTCLLQLKANGPRPYSERLGTDLDNVPAIASAERCMKQAGHIGFTP